MKQQPHTGALPERGPLGTPRRRDARSPTSAAAPCAERGRPGSGRHAKSRGLRCSNPQRYQPRASPGGRGGDGARSDASGPTCDAPGRADVRCPTNKELGAREARGAPAVLNRWGGERHRTAAAPQHRAGRSSSPNRNAPGSARSPSAGPAAPGGSPSSATPPPHPRSIPKPPPAPGRSSPASPSTAAAAAARQSSTTRSAAIAAPGRRPPPRSLGLPGHRAPLRRRQPPPAGGHGRREAAGPGRAAPSGAAGPGRPPGSHRRRECGAPPRRRPPPPPPATPPQPARQSERPSRPAAPRPAPPYEGRRRPPAAQRGDPTGRAGTALRPRRGVNWRGRAWGSRARHRGRAAAGTERAPKPLCCRGLSAGSPRPAMHREEGALTARRGKSLHPETKRRFSSRSGEGTWPQMEVSGYRQPEAVPRSHPTALQRPLSLGPVSDGRFHSIL